MNRPWLIILAFLGAFMLVGTLEREWHMQSKGLAPQPAKMEAALPLTMPCQWVSITRAGEPINPRCVNTDLRGTHAER